MLCSRCYSAIALSEMFHGSSLPDPSRVMCSVCSVACEAGNHSGTCLQSGL